MLKDFNLNELDNLFNLNVYTNNICLLVFMGI